MTDPTDWYSSTRVSLPADATALVLAGGKGTRLRDAAKGLPKPLVPIDSPHGRIPMLGHIINEVAAAGFRRVAVLTSSDPDAHALDVETYATRTFAQRLDLTLLREPRPLGTAGAVYAALRQLGCRTAAIVPADTLFPCHLLPIAASTHVLNGTDATWAVTSNPGPDAQNTGRILIDPSNRRVVHALEGSSEEPSADALSALSAVTSVGVVLTTRDRYLTRFHALVHQLTPRPLDLYREFLPALIRDGHPVSSFDIRTAAPDLGTPDRLAAFGRTS